MRFALNSLVVAAGLSLSIALGALQALAEDSLGGQYGATIHDRLNSSWKPPATGQSKVWVLFQLSEAGDVTYLYVCSEPRNAAFEDSVRSIFKGSFGQKAAEVRRRQYIWMTFEGRGGYKAVCGPYFTEKQPAWVNKMNHSK